MLSPEQVTQLYELMKETQLVRDGKSGEIEGDESHEKH